MDDDIFDDPLDKINPDELRAKIIREIHDFPHTQFLMENVTVPDDDDETIYSEPFCEVRHTDNKGRILIAKMDFRPGDVILREKPFANGSWSEYHCTECLKPHKPTGCALFKAKYPPSLRSNIEALEEAFADEEMIGELDRARLFIKCMFMYHFTRDAPAFQEFLTLTTVNEQECLECIENLRKRKVVQASQIFPPNMPSVDAARILSILNCNSHEIEHIGSGIFLRASMMEHDCMPNCNFVTERDEINVVCIKPIKAGEPMSIDYSHAVYKPTAVRQEEHKEAYGFICTCAMCTTLPDRARVFYCPQGVRNVLAGKPQPAANSHVTPDTCHAGLVCPAGLGDKLEHWKCLNCGYNLTEGEVNVCLDAEKRHPAPPEVDDDEESEEVVYELAGMKIRDVEDIGAILSENIMHEAHHVVFWSMMALAFRLTKRASAISVPTIGKGRNSKKDKEKAQKAQQSRTELCNKAAMVWQRVIAAADIGLPGYHPNKVNYLDHLAQVKVLAKDIVAANELWKQAYEMSIIVNGAHTLNTLQLRKLYKHTPRTVEAMQFHYQNMHTVLDRIAYEEDKESANLLSLLAESTLDQEKLEKKNMPLPNEEESESEEEEEEEEEEDPFGAQRLGFAASAQKYLESQGLAAAAPTSGPFIPVQEQKVVEPEPVAVAEVPAQDLSADGVQLSFNNIKFPTEASNPFAFATQAPQNNTPNGEFNFRG